MVCGTIVRAREHRRRARPRWYFKAGPGVSLLRRIAPSTIVTLNPTTCGSIARPRYARSSSRASHRVLETVRPGGRLVTPVRWNGQGHRAAVTSVDDRLVFDSSHLCGFVYLVGEDERRTHHPNTADEPVTLHWGRDQPTQHLGFARAYQKGNSVL